MTSQTLAKALDDLLHEYGVIRGDLVMQNARDGFRDKVTAHLAAILADVETIEAVAEAIHSHMKAVRDRGDYIVGPASDDAARAAIAVIGARLGLA